MFEGKEESKVIGNIEAFELYEKWIALWGSTSQFMMVIEELNELATVLCHALRANKPFDLETIKGEMIDVLIMLEQLQHMLKLSNPELNEERQKKLRRLKELIKFDEEHR